MRGDFYMAESNSTRKRNGNRQNIERESAIISRSAAVMRQERTEQSRKSTRKSSDTYRNEGYFQAKKGVSSKTSLNKTSSNKTSSNKISSGKTSSNKKSSSGNGSAAKTSQKQREREVLLRLRIILAASIVLCAYVILRLMANEPQNSTMAESVSSAAVSTEPTSEDSALSTTQTAAVTAAPTQTPAEIYLEENRTSIPSRFVIDTDSILQEPELPTGCESVALTMALNSLGFSLDKTTIADDYLVYNDSNLVIGYVGDPYEYDGAGIFPHGLTSTANKYLKAQNSTQTAYDISGTDFEDLLVYIGGGYPVVMWSTIGYEDVEWSRDSFEFQGKKFRWYWNEHCVMLQGYDLDDEDCYILDPLQGEVEIEIDRMKKIYDEIGKYAIVIM